MNQSTRSLQKSPLPIIVRIPRQSLSSQSLPSPEEIFGKHPDGTPRVDFAPNRPGNPQQDLILEKCYRNSRPVLVTAHALGFGIYRTPGANSGTGLVQVFDHSQLWHEVGYEVADGDLADGCEVRLSRSEDSSPGFLEDYSPVDDLIQFHCFDSKEEQARWVTNAIQSNLAEDELRPDDIRVVPLDNFMIYKDIIRLDRPD